MAKYEWSEVFMSIEGEGPHSGRPTVYIRFARCNFQCRGFNNPKDLDTTSIDVLGFDPKNYSNIQSIPLITRGCDSIYSWDEKFKHMWRVGDEEALGKEVVSVLPHNKWIHPVTRQPVILSLTGGEPTLRAKFIPTLLKHELFADCLHILIETNCSVPLKAEFIDELTRWEFGHSSGSSRRVTWSNSPKIHGSGEKWEDAIRPEVAQMQMHESFRHSRGNWEQYFKFVCAPTDQSFDAVERAMSEYYKVGVSRFTPVYIMPVACTEEQQQEIAAKVARMCIERGYTYCHRIQNSVFGNGVGT